MFDHETWRRSIATRLNNFARNPRQDVQLAGAPTLLGYLVTRTIEPFLDAFQREPIAAVLALAEISRGPGADQFVLRATRLRYPSAAQIDRDLRTSAEQRIVAEQLLVELQTLPLARQRLNSTREHWLRTSLELELEQFPNEFAQLRRVLHDPSWQTRYDALRGLRVRQGRFSPADLVLIHDGLSDSAAHVRTAAARCLGVIAETPPAVLVKALVRMAIHDRDAETRYAAARSIGTLRGQITSPHLLDYLSGCLFDDDSFVRSAAALVLGQLGEVAGAPMLVKSLIRLLDDRDTYAREAAARALGRIGQVAATPEVMAALQQAAEDGEIAIHEAATESLQRLRELRAAAPIQLAVHA
ncbi:MAG: HEAT repeat domain-containing protein [Roseiflexaceae bacterium]|nr:HEAT repeat domain-containing protein [Roseiflexaceae bacterium]